MKLIRAGKHLKLNRKNIMATINGTQLVADAASGYLGQARGINLAATKVVKAAEQAIADLKFRVDKGEALVEGNIGGYLAAVNAGLDSVIAQAQSLKASLPDGAGFIALANTAEE